MPTLRTGNSSARPTTRQAASRPALDRSTSFSTKGVSRQGSTDSIGGDIKSRRNSSGNVPSSTSKRPTSSSRRQSTSVTAGSAKDRVTVTVRKRPAKDGEVDVVSVEDYSQVLVAEPKQKVDLTRYTEHHQFGFDFAFDERAENVMVYNCTAKPLVQFVLDGGMGTCFAFGQTGSGKTFTMLGAPEVGQPGLYLLAADDVFRACDQNDVGIEVYVSMMEIYGDEVFDLLSADKRKLIPREDAKKKVQIQGLTELRVCAVQDMMEAIAGGSQQRSTSTTGMNEQSSRSHAILQMSLRTPRGRLHGQLSFIDLAGSEKGSDTAENEKKTRLEGAEINKSLLALKECIRSMTDASTYTPFRGSKLTQVLKESFVGHGRTVMIANVSPSAPSCTETVNTLRYAERVKAIGKAAAPASKPTTPSAAASPAPVPGLALQFSGGRLVLPGGRAEEEEAKRSARKGRDRALEREKENVGNASVTADPPRRGGAGCDESMSGGGGGRRRQSHLTLGRYEAESEEEQEQEPTHKRRRSWGRAGSGGVGGGLGRLSGCSAEPSFDDVEAFHDDEGFVFHEQHPPARGPALPAPVPVPVADPAKFVNAFREQIERSMALIEEEVAMLDTLERSGADPLTPANVEQVSRLLTQRMNIATHLQNELRAHTRK